MATDVEQFVLRWHYHEATLLNTLPCFLDNDIFTDCVLSVGAQQFKAHKIVLAMCSAYFFQLFQETTNNSQQHHQPSVIVLHNVSIEDVRAILAFIYRGQCVVARDHLPALLSVAKLLKIQGLCDMKVPEKSNHVQTDDLIEEHELIEPKLLPRNAPSSSSSVLPPTVVVPQRQPVQRRRISDNQLSADRCNRNNYGSNSTTRSSTPSTTDFELVRNNDVQTTTLDPSPSPSQPHPVIVRHCDTSTTSEVLNLKKYASKSPSTTEMNDKPLPPLLNSSTLVNTSPALPNKRPKDPSETCKCFLCGKYLSNQYNLRVHMETHEEVFHACQSCPHVSRSRDALRKHVSYRHPEEYQTRKRKKLD